MDRFESMRALQKVVELGSFSAAARALNLSPSMVTKHVTSQEERLGARLLHRSTRKISLTEIGRLYHALIEQIVTDVDDAEALASENQKAVRGLLRVNCPVTLGTRHIAPVMLALQSRHPDLTIELDLNDRLVDLGEEGWDLTIRSGRLSSSNLIARKLASCEMMLCASAGYLALHGTPSRVSDLRNHACLGYTLSKTVGYDTWAFGIDGEVVVPVSGPFRTNSGDALVAAAVAGQGLTYQPGFMLGDAVRAGKLISLKLDYPFIDMGGIYAIYLRGPRLPAKARAFIDFLVTCFDESPPGAGV